MKKTEPKRDVMHIGSFDAFTGKMLVADPVYACEPSGGDPFALALKVKVRPGTYDAFVLTSRYPRIGDRVSHVLIALRDRTIPRGRKFAWSDPVGEVGIDTGRMGFYDATRYPVKEHNDIYDRTRYDTTVEGNLGVVSSTGLGDGFYQVYASRYQGHVVALLGWFGDDDVDYNEIVSNFVPFAPFLLEQQNGEPVTNDFNPPAGSIGSPTTRLAWQKFIEYAINGIETAELNAATMLALGRDPSLSDIAREREYLECAMRFLYTEMRDELHFTEEQLENRYGALAAAVEKYLEAARGLFYLAIDSVNADKKPVTTNEVVSGEERLKRIERMYYADRCLEMNLLFLFNSLMRAQGDTPPPAPITWKTDPKIVPLRK